MYSTCHPDGTSHAGAAVIIKKTLKHQLLQDYRTAHIQATSLASHGRRPTWAPTVTSTYCPSRHVITAKNMIPF